MLLDNPSQHTTNGFLVRHGTYNDPISDGGGFTVIWAWSRNQVGPGLWGPFPNTYDISPLTGTAVPL